MRTTGTFAEVYEAARAYYRDEDPDAWGGCPMDPVVRFADGEWVLESGIEGQGCEDADFECSLEAFDRYFREVYGDSGFSPADEDIREFLDIMAD